MNDKAKYAKIVKQLEEISVTLGKLGDSIFDEDRELCKKFYFEISNIMFDLEGPIVKKYPSLRPPAMLDQNAKCRYDIMRHDHEADAEEIILRDVAPDEAEETIRRIEAEEKTDETGFFYLELSNYSTR